MMPDAFVAAIRKRRDFLVLSGDYGNQITARTLNEIADVIEAVEKEEIERAGAAAIAEEKLLGEEDRSDDVRESRSDD